MTNKLAKLGGLAASLAIPGIAFAQTTNNQLNSIIDLLNPFNFNIDPNNINIGLLFTQVLNLVLIVAAIIAILYLIWAGIQYITASTDEEKAKKARTAIYNAIIGIVVIILAYAIIVFVGNIVKQNIPGGTNNAGVGGFNNSLTPLR